jgi:hypothetical protein
MAFPMTCHVCIKGFLLESRSWHTYHVSGKARSAEAVALTYSGGKHYLVFADLGWVLTAGVPVRQKLAKPCMGH